MYTMWPVFSLVLDVDVDEHLANLYPELYKELTEGRSLSYWTFGVWLLVSIYQGEQARVSNACLTNARRRRNPRAVANPRRSRQL